MTTLSLPPPTNITEQDTLLTSAGGGAVNGVQNGVEAAEGGKKKSEVLLEKGVIYPPREIRAIIDKTAIHISKSPSPTLLEDRIREHQKSDPKFSFLRDSDPFNAYYRYMIERVREEGEGAVNAPAGAVAAGGETAQPEQGKKKEKKEEVEPPREWEFLVEVPNVTGLDLDILRLTALFVARRGRSFLASLSQREGRNFQFDFLRPTHSLFGYFNRMVEAYVRVLAPTEELLARLEIDVPRTSEGGVVTLGKDEEGKPKLLQGAGDKWQILKEARARGEWLRTQQESSKKAEEEREKEQIAFAEIDWQDFVVVQTIEFTSTDTTIDLPPPTTIKEMQRLALGERRMAALVEEETGAAADEGDDGEMDIDMDEDAESEDEEVKETRKKEKEELERARAVQAKAMGQAGMKIRKDYVPKGLAGRQQAQVAMTICPYCKQSIPENEISEHIRIELLDPKWKEQKQLLDLKKTQAAQLLQGADVSASLKQLANARTDLFGTAEEEDARKKQEDEERATRRAKESIIWDGHLASKTTTVDTFQSKYNLDEQINAIHSRHALIANNSANTVGPQMGAPGPQPGSSAQASVSGTPGGVSFSGATISAGPQGPSAPSYLQHQNYPPQQSYNPFPDQPEFDPSIFSMPSMPMPPPDGSEGPLPPAPAGLPQKPAGIHPSRLAAIGGDSPVQLAGQTRPYEEDGDAGQSQSVKRQRVDKLPGGQFYTESDWIRMHPNPISISVKLPIMPERPEWKLDGSIITIDDLPLNFLFSTLRDRIQSVIDSPVPISRMKLDYGAKTLSNSSNLASVNLEDGDVIVLTIRKK